MKPKGPRPVAVPEEPLEPLHLVFMDFDGPLPATKNGNRYILTLTDYFTKWVEFYPLKEKTRECVAQRIQSFIFR